MTQGLCKGTPSTLRVQSRHMGIYFLCSPSAAFRLASFATSLKVPGHNSRSFIAIRAYAITLWPFAFRSHFNYHLSAALSCGSCMCGQASNSVCIECAFDPPHSAKQFRLLQGLTVLSRTKGADWCMHCGLVMSYQL